MGFREYVDSSGVPWQVWDTYPGSTLNVRERFAGGWLGFASDRERRRLSPVPPGWETATDDEIGGWLASAEITETTDGLSVLRRRQNRLSEAEQAENAKRLDRQRRADDLSSESEVANRTRSVIARARQVIRSVGKTLDET